jgi:hypothetical protein
VALLAAALTPEHAPAQTIDGIDAVAPFLDHCVAGKLRGVGTTPPREVTLRVSFRRDGAFVGEPAVSYLRPTRGDPGQERFIADTIAAFKSCAPLPFSSGLGGAIAGRIFTFRYTLTTAKDQTL